MSDFLLQLITDEAGVSAIEYAILGALIAVAITAGANTLGQNLGAVYNAVAACVEAPDTGLPCAL